MRFVKRKTHDENYENEVKGICPVCGEEIYYGDKCYVTDEGDVHEECLKQYVVMSDYSADEIATALQLDRKVWCYG